jgi:1-acyl-sn-glycerol-3-phosphate acyltransferase
MQIISKFIYHRLLGWNFTGFNEFSTVKKAIIIAAPHTSWHDFYIGVLLRSIIQLQINFVGKQSLFTPLTAWFFRSLGGTPIKRNSNENQVDSIARLFDNKEIFRMAIAPEGTRKKIDPWKTGFYYIAKGANVPIVMGTLDFGKKQVKISEPYYLTDNMEQDFEHFYSYFRGVKGKIPENFNL